MANRRPTVIEVGPTDFHQQEMYPPSTSSAAPTPRLPPKQVKDTNALGESTNLTDNRVDDSGSCFRQLLSIRVLAAGLCAIFIIATAICLLVTTFSFSISAGNDIAERQAISIATKAKGDIESFINEPLRSVAGWQYVHSQNDHPLPKDYEQENPLWYNAYWDDFTAAMSSTGFQYQFALFGFDDGNYVACKNMPAETFQCRLFHWANRNISDPTSMSVVHDRNYFRSNFSLISEAFSTTSYDPRTRSWWTMVERKPFAMIWTDVYLSAAPTLPIIDIIATIYNASGAMLGIGSITFELGTLSTFLTNLVTTENTVSVLIDNQDMLLASSHHVPFLTSTNIPKTYAGVVPANCLKSDSDHATLSIMLCRARVAEYAYAPLRELVASHPDLVQTGAEGAQSMKLDDTDYFVSVVPISTPLATRMHWRFALFVPQSDIVGGIIRGRDIAIYISIAIVIVSVGVCFLGLTLLMSPLQSVTESMYKLATLQDTDESASAPSSLYEISIIQSAFKVMSAELTKVKSFLPQSVLAQLYGGITDVEDEGDHAEEDTATKDMRSKGTGSVYSTLTPIAAAHAQQFDATDPLGATPSLRPNETPTVSSNARRGKARGLNTQVVVSTRRVTMLVANIVNYHSHVVGADHMSVVAASAELVAAISGAMNEHKGVLDGFQGDRFVASFNAVTAAGNHSSAAAGAALAAASAVTNVHTPGGKPLRLSSGIASGPCIVGNMGTQALKRFTVLGPTVTTAALLERLCKRYPGVNSLVGGNAIFDTKNFFELLTCDVVLLPTSNHGPKRTRIAAVMRIAARNEDEWMYQLEYATKTSNFGEVNSAFSSFIEGDAENAKEMLEKARNTGDMSDLAFAATVELLSEKLAANTEGKEYANALVEFYAECMLNGVH